MKQQHRSHAAQDSKSTKTQHASSLHKNLFAKMVWLTAGVSVLTLSGCGTLSDQISKLTSRQTNATPISPAKPTSGAPSESKPTAQTAPESATAAAKPVNTAVPTATPLPRPTSTPLPPTVAPSTLVKATPSAGRANIEGRVLWNGKGVADLPVRLCEDRSTLSDCKGNKQETKTNASGDYRFANVTPGEYTVEAKAFDKPYWIFTKGDSISARKYKVEADKTISVSTLNIFKLDLKVNSPRHKATIKESKPLIKWSAYPETDYYEVYVSPAQGVTVVNNERVYSNEPTEFQIPDALLNCKYNMRIAAFNANKIKLAEQEETFIEFTVTGQDAPCEAKITSPQRDATNVDGKNLTLRWEKHNRAAYYKLVMYPQNSSDKKILDFVQVENELTYKLPQALSAGKYSWWVQVFDNTDKHVASSPVANFTVK
jgi:hypothetical protein